MILREGYVILDAAHNVIGENVTRVTSKVINK
jgi:hypothetical protein